MAKTAEQHPLYQKFKNALNIHNDMRPGPNPFIVSCIEIAQEYANQQAGQEEEEKKRAQGLVEALGK